MPSENSLAWRGDPAEIVAEFDHAEHHRSFVLWLESIRPTWHADAACVGEPTRLFFPARGEPTRPALSICDRCPVRDECLDDAIADPDLDHGFRGGLPARSRSLLRRTLQSSSRGGAS